MRNSLFKQWKDKLLLSGNIEPLWFGMSQEELKRVLGQPDDMSSEVVKGNHLIFKYADIEFHFDERFGHKLFLVFSEDGIVVRSL